MVYFVSCDIVPMDLVPESTGRCSIATCLGSNALVDFLPSVPIDSVYTTNGTGRAGLERMTLGLETIGVVGVVGWVGWVAFQAIATGAVALGAITIGLVGIRLVLRFLRGFLLLFDGSAVQSMRSSSASESLMRMTPSDVVVSHGEESFVIVTVSSVMEASTSEVTVSWKTIKQL